MIVTPLCSTIFPASDRAQFPPRSTARSTMTEPGFMLSTISLVIRTGAGLPGMRAVVTTMSCDFRCSAIRAACLLPVILAQFLGVAALRCGILQPLDENEFGAEALHLFRRRRPDIRRRDDGAEPSRRGDRLEACNARTHDEHPCRRHRSRRRHHHRKGAGILRGGVDHRLVAGKIGLRRQHVHRLARA